MAAGTANPPSASPRAWRWVPSLYFCEGIPYVIVTTVAVVLYKNLGVSNTAIAFYTSWLTLPWVIKPLWSPIVDRFRTKRLWVVSLQFLMGVALALVALTVPGPGFFRSTLVVFWLVAFSSATHDIAADGFYLLALPPHLQAAFVGVRNTFFRLAVIAGQGGLVFLAGFLQTHGFAAAKAWAAVLVLPAALFGCAGLYHHLFLPRPVPDRPVRDNPHFAADFIQVFAAFFRKPGIAVVLAFLLLYRLGEAQLVRLVQPFLLDRRAAGGLGLSTEQVGVFYGTVGVIALLAGGLLGGYLISRLGLKLLLWPMALALNLPNAVYVWLAWQQPSSLAVIGGALTVEQFGYGFGFTAYMVYMMLVSEGEHRTAHYALCTGFMALGMMLPGLPAGWIQDHLGYARFFVWVCVATIPSFAATALLKPDPAYGRRT